jgi:hypothetical protein
VHKNEKQNKSWSDEQASSSSSSPSSISVHAVQCPWTDLDAWRSTDAVAHAETGAAALIQSAIISTRCSFVLHFRWEEDISDLITVKRLFEWLAIVPPIAVPYDSLSIDALEFSSLEAGFLGSQRVKPIARAAKFRATTTCSCAPQAQSEATCTALCPTHRSITAPSEMPQQFP